MTVRVLVVDDSALVRTQLVLELSRHAGIEVVGTAPNPFVARDKIVRLQPDVLLLDLEMPRMDGLTFLAKLMRYRPMPVIIVSSATPSGSTQAVRALETGAFDIVCKPTSGFSLEAMIDELVVKIRAAVPSSSRPWKRGRAPLERVAPAPMPTGAHTATTPPTVVVVGASTGGTQAIRDVLSSFPPDAPPTLIVQHMPPQFTASFASRLDQLCQPTVREATRGDLLVPGLVLVAPGGLQTVITRSANQFRVDVKEGPAVSGHRPSVDVLFRSAAKAAGASAIGVLLTGMGHDGARGMAALYEAGATTIAQDAASCVVFGMPKAAIEAGAVMHVISLEHVAATVLRLAQRRPEGAADASASRQAP